MAMGDYAGAFSRLRPMAGDHGELAGLAAAALASGLRQLGDHRLAVPFDDLAIASCGAGRVDGLIGAAADRVGMGDAAAATEALRRARSEAAWWRDEVRCDWVATEIALLTDVPQDAVVAAERAAACAAAAESIRHDVKSRLFLAVARRVAEPGGAGPILHQVVRDSRRHHLRPLLWPAVSVLGAAATADEAAASRAAVGYIAGHRPAGVGAGWDGLRVMSQFP
jgi:hypothetical protein